MGWVGQVRSSITRPSVIVQRLDRLEREGAKGRGALYALGDYDSEEEECCEPGGLLNGHDFAELERAARELSVDDVTRLLRTSCGCRQSDVAAFAQMGVDGVELLRMARHPAKLRSVLETARCPRRRQDRIQRELRNLPALLWGIRRQRPTPLHPRPPSAQSTKGVGLGCGLSAPEEPRPEGPGASRLAAALARSPGYHHRRSRRCADPAAPTEEPWREVAAGQWCPPWRMGWLERVEAALQQRRERHADANSLNADEESYQTRVRAFQARARKAAEEKEAQEEAEAIARAEEEARAARQRIEEQRRKLTAERDAKTHALRQHDRERREWLASDIINKKKLSAEIDSAILSSKREMAGGPRAEKGRRVSVVTREEAPGASGPRTADVGTCAVGPPTDGWSPISEISVAHKGTTHRRDPTEESESGLISPKAILALLNESDSP
eukprot:Hpha_TRINITY_DN4084_c0_g1::TRINITY_DN4084_c0_g1_i1::g.63763::m.63763